MSPTTSIKNSPTLTSCHTRPCTASKLTVTIIGIICLAGAGILGYFLFPKDSKHTFTYTPVIVAVLLMIIPVLVNRKNEE